MRSRGAREGANSTVVSAHVAPRVPPMQPLAWDFCGNLHIVSLLQSSGTPPAQVERRMACWLRVIRQEMVQASERLGTSQMRSLRCSNELS